MSWFLWLVLTCSSWTSAATNFGISSPHPLHPELIRAALRSNSNRNGSQPIRNELADRPAGKTKPRDPSPADLCPKMNVNGRQKRLCFQGGGLPETLMEAIRMSASACQQQFQYERWNCPLDEERIPFLEKGMFRETAALHALSAAGVEHAVSRACAAGRLEKCHCAEADNPIETRQTWKWGGCGDNLSYGRIFALKFLDAGTSKSEGQPAVPDPGSKSQVGPSRGRWKRTMATNSATNRKSNELWPSATNKINGSRKSAEHSIRLKMERHNNAVGLRVVEQLVNRTCKCHGVSGSCTVQTCWNQLAPFSETARVIKSKYDAAVRHRSEISENSSHARVSGSSKEPSKKNQKTSQKSGSKRRSSWPKSQQSAPSDGGKWNRNQLLFVDESPDFCNTSDPFWPRLKGTWGRPCLRDQNCQVLCCGRGYHVHKTRVTVPCRCKLILCCQVECQNCLVEKQIDTCK